MNVVVVCGNEKPCIFYKKQRTCVCFLLVFVGYIWYNNYMEKDIYNIKEEGLTYGRGYVYSLQYHIV